MRGGDRTYLGRIEPNLRGIAMYTDEGRTRRRQALQNELLKLELKIRQLNETRAKLLDCIDDPLPIPQAYAIANVLFLSGVTTNTERLSFILCNDLRVDEGEPDE